MSTDFLNGRLLRVVTAAILLAAAGGCAPHDFADNNPQLYVAFGDSITSGNGHPTIVPYPARLAQKLGRRVVNEGYDAMPSDFGRAVDQYVLEDHHPGYLLILFGANDILYGREAEDLAANLRSIIRECRERRTLPVVATLTPVATSHSYMAPSVRYANELIRRLVDEEGAFLVDLELALGWDPAMLQEDGLHPSEEGTERIANAFAEVVTFIELLLAGR